MSSHSHAVSIQAGEYSAKVLPFGATLVELIVPDATGQLGDVVLGFSNPDDWTKLPHPCLNTVIGRVSGRIGPDSKNGQIGTAGFTLDGTSYILEGCDGSIGKLRPSTNLHGGPKGFDKQEWTIAASDTSSVTLKYVSADGDQGFPGELETLLTYSLTEDGELRLRYEATTTKATPVSLTSHAYFNLSAGTDSTIREHTLQLHCPAYNPDDGSGDGVPTGERRLVVGTCRDYSSPVPLSQIVDSQAFDTPDWPHGGQFVVGAMEGRNPNEVADLGNDLPCVGVLCHPASGRVMTVFSSEPICQTYYSTLLGGMDASKCKGGIEYGKHGAICLEMHRHANAVNVEAFPSNVLQPGQRYRQLTIYKFSTLQPGKADEESLAKRQKS